jgi:hypothetical protein
MSEQHPDPGGEAAARVAQLAAMTVSVGEALARLRAQRTIARADDDRRDQAALRAFARVDAARAGLVYRQALSPSWVRGADTTQLLTAWHCAGPYREHDPTANLAADRVEQRLRQLHPEAMAVYDGVELRGLPPDYRMQQASRLLRGPYGLDPIGTPIAAAERAHAADNLAAPDLQSTRTVDERTTARADAAGHAGRAAALDGGLTGNAFPVPIHEAMRTAPAAAHRAVRAITAGPVPKQLTATPHQASHQRSSR